MGDPEGRATWSHSLPPAHDTVLKSSCLGQEMGTPAQIWLYCCGFWVSPSLCGPRPKSLVSEVLRKWGVVENREGGKGLVLGARLRVSG